jgi:hypothetical protein
MKLARIGVFLLLVGVLILTIAPSASAQSSSTVNAQTSGFGAAFAFSQTIGGISYAQVGTIGNASANALATTPISGAQAFVLTNGIAAGNAFGLGTPWGTQAQIQLISWNGSANGFAIGWN